MKTNPWYNVRIAVFISPKDKPLRKQINTTVVCNTYHQEAKNDYGYTLIETIIVLGILSILSSSAIFYFLQNHAQTKTHLAAEQLIHHLQYARSEAIKRNQVVGVCGITADNQCSTNWDKGYFIYTSAHPQSTQREIIKINKYSTSYFSTRSQFATQAQAVQFAPSGRVYHNGKIVIQPHTTQATPYVICISLAGRIKHG